ncbi:MAG: twin-arginine translocation signal domain-containing protein [Acidobacteria bacterium]|nr:twin-arginine translocation signal domain-containing protein [Acidobacteriota bacterium]
MPLDRRTFLATSAAAGAALGTSGLWGREPKTAPKPLRILILGGTGFIGPAVTTIAQARGHKVIFFNRGKTRTNLFPEVEKLIGDRDPKKGDGLKALEGHDWDVVLDDSGQYPRMVGASASLLADHAKRYIYISSISCYKEPAPMNGDEDSPLATLADPTVETMGDQFQNYGGLKALCEQAAEKAMPGRVAVVRPGYIVGPDDYSGRFTYWPVRFDKGGEIAVPGAPTDPLQVIDVRDLAAWLVKLAEDGTTGRFNAVGPEKRLDWGRVIKACQAATSAKTTPVWMDTDFILKQQDAEFPIWAPYAGETKGFHTWRNDRAMKAGLRFRPIEAIVKDTLAWHKGLAPDDRRARLAGPSAEAEAKLIAAWKASQKPKAS